MSDNRGVVYLGAGKVEVQTVSYTHLDVYKRQSGIRIGTPAVTTRGFKVAQCQALAGWICDILDHLGDADVEAQVAKLVAGLCADYPVYR